jgi:hypothetical protein
MHDVTQWIRTIFCWGKFTKSLVKVWYFNDNKLSRIEIIILDFDVFCFLTNILECLERILQMHKLKNQQIEETGTL